jgi:hypothetical protein
MRRVVPDSNDFRNSGFRKFVDGFLPHSGLPFASVLTAEKIAGICHKYLLKCIAACPVGNRPGRLEPRVIKRRRHAYPLMQMPRHVLKAPLCKHCS